MFNGAFTEALLIGLAALLVLAAVIDVRTFTISNRLNLAVAALAPLYWLSIPLAPWPDVASQLAVAAGVFVLLAAAFYAGMMGGGDVKLAAALALWFSPQSTIKFLVLMSLAGGVVTLPCWPGTAPSAGRAGRKFRMVLRSHSAVSRYSGRYSPNGFLTILPDV